MSLAVTNDYTPFRRNAWKLEWNIEYQHPTGIFLALARTVSLIYCSGNILNSDFELVTKVRSLRGSRAGYACIRDRGPTPPATSLFAYFFLMAQPRQFSKCRECFRKLFGSGDCSNLVP
jgi:hypothetical protein